MRIQFNLVPDIKQEYIKAQKTKRTIMAIATIATLVSAGIFVLMLSVVYGVNKLQLSQADKSIKNNQKQLDSISNISKVLTVQNQLTSLTALHDSRNLSSRMFDFLTQLTPSSAHLGHLTADFVADTLQLSGTADSQKTINTFIDTLKFTTYKTGGTDSGKKAFTSVVETTYGVDKTGSSFQLDIQFDPALFNTAGVSLEIPSGLSTTRSVLEDPSNVLFNGQTGSSSNNQSGGGQ